MQWKFARWSAEPERTFTQQTLLEQSRDYQDLIRPVLVAGRVASTVEALVEYAQETRQHYNHHADGLAHAYYSLAIERAAPTMALYLGRAFVTQDYFQNSMEEESEANIKEIIAVITLDFARAFDLGHLESCNDVVYYLTFDWIHSETGRPTAHQQIEALLKIRRDLTAHGLRAATTNALLKEVERALAA